MNHIVILIAAIPTHHLAMVAALATTHPQVQETNMKKPLLLVISAISAYAVSWSQMAAALDNQPVLKSAKHEVSAYGFNFRQYTWIDPAGRICTTAITDSKGLGLSCEFPPKDFDYTSFQQRLK